ncbi:MarR family winged helix-turn-helix transcriptional regulator [Pontibacter liquoris]|uniref:MarR family winged helix-turn-helix transcriptional regulator n=1 Tax=Pontibacter liquoris TaxID=2905677 RepID=UPI001FA80223|nr:MarR family transcriptional regulator [Pontibacter liquoris]
MRQKFKAYDVNITFEMLEVLRFLWKKDGINQQEIADAILKDKASLTYLLDNLVRRKLVQRTEDSRDRRNKIITLTKEGQQMKDLILPWITEMYEIAGREIPNELIGSGLLLFESIYRNFEQQHK